MTAVRCFFGSFALATVALIAGCGGGKPSAARPPAEGGTLVLATTLGSEPYAYQDETGEIVGIDISIARAAAANLGYELEIRPMAFSQLLSEVKNGDADFAAAAITITPARARDVDFTDSYAFDGSAFIYRAGSPRPTVSRGNTLRIGTQSASNNQFYLSDHGIDSISYPDFATALDDFKSGNLDAVFYDGETVRRAVEQSGGAFVMTPLFTREKFALAVRKDFPQLTAAINEVLRARKEKSE